MKKKLFQEIASRLNAADNCAARGNREWQARHEAAVDQLVKDFMPSGSGIDSGTKLDEAARTHNPANLYFTTAFHHMDENGGYDGWTEHRIIVSPSLQFGFNIKITGRDRNEIKDYLHEIFSHALNREVEQNEAGEYIAV